MIFIAADHRGYYLKKKLLAYLEVLGFEVSDLGASELIEDDDYPDYAKEVAKHLVEKEDRGILVCGSGVGISIAANKFPGVRCGLGFNDHQVRAAREEDDINCLAIAADYMAEDQVKKAVRIFLETDFVPKDRYIRRIEKLERQS